MANLVNRTALKRLILDRRRVIKPAWSADRVSESSLDYIESRMRVLVDDALRRHPTIGVTVKFE